MKAAFFITFWLACSLVLQAQTNVRAWYAKGQTFVVWDTGGQQAATWDVYRAGTAITGIGQGTLSGRMFIKEAQGERLKLAGISLTWRVPDGAGGIYQLTSSEALFAYTPHTVATEYFAVVRRGQSAVASSNRTASAVAENFDATNDPVICHRQAQLTNTAGYAYSIWSMWADGRDDPDDARPDIPIMANFAKNGAPHVFAVYEPTGGPVNGPLPAVVALHGGGDTDGSYRRFQPGINAQDIGIVMPAGLLVVPDDVVYRVISITPTFSVDTLHTLWMGWRTNWDPYTVYPSSITLPPDNSTIVNYSMRRLDWTLQWLLTRSPWNVDAHRVSVMGGSMGGGGTSLQARWKPERYASAVAFVPRMVGPSTNDASSAQGNGVELLGSGGQNLPTNLTNATGATFGVNDLFQPQTLLSTAQRDFPLMRFYIGRNDTAVVWGLPRIINYQNINNAAWGAHLFWDSRVHGSESWSSGDPPGQHIAEWVAPVQTERASAPYQARYRNDQSFPGFFNDDQNAALPGRQPSMGNGDPLDGDLWGTWSGYYDWDLNSITDTTNAWGCTIFLLGQSAVSVDNYPGTTATASVAIRKPQQFNPAPGAAVNWQFRRLSDDVILQSGATLAASNGLVTITNLTIYRDPTRGRLEAWLAGTTIAPVNVTDLTLPLNGTNRGQLQLQLTGLAGQSFILDTSTNLALWLPLATNTLDALPLIYSDVQTTNFDHRFYRTRLP